jgi:hypothetical protein
MAVQDGASLLSILTKAGKDPLKRWNHPNHLAGFLADIAILLHERGIIEADPVRDLCHSPSMQQLADRFRRAAVATRNAAKRVWTKGDRQAFRAHWARVTGRPHALTRPRTTTGNSYCELVQLAASILCDQDVRFFWKRREYLASSRAWVTISEDDVSDLEIRWRIRDWLSLTDAVTNIPPRERLAAAAAWRVGAHAVAFQIVVDAAAAVVAKSGI